MAGELAVHDTTPDALDQVLDRIEGDDHQPSRPPLRVIDGDPDGDAQDRERYVDSVLERAVGLDNPGRSRPQRQAQRGYRRPAKSKREMTDEERFSAIVDDIEGPDEPTEAGRTARSHPAGSQDATNQAEITRRAAMLADEHMAQRAESQIVMQWNACLQEVANEFPFGPPDPQHSEPMVWYRWQHHVRAVQELEPYVHQIVSHAAAKRRALFNELGAVEDAEFARRNPDADADLAMYSINILHEHGLNDAQIYAALEGEGGASLEDPRVQSVLAEAVRYVTGRRLEVAADLHAETVKYLREIGFSPDDLSALGNGAMVTIRDHRARQVLADAARGRMGAQ